MKIHSMTATFGKLENRTLTLKPGLNVISAPNEWGKSTWCAFLLAMLYGVDTRAKSSRAGLADKDHYAPWSGSPMSGRIELEWQGKNITIERTTKGRIPLGAFRAYETDTGLDVPELTAETCGETLLGVEREVYRRSGFIRLADLPVSEDEALRRRLNALVTTGDESGDGARLEQGLKELKNKCRYNRSGLLPQAERERDGLRDMLGELLELGTRQAQLSALQEEAVNQQKSLQNHEAALAYEAALADARRVTQAEEEKNRRARHLQQLANECALLPSHETAANQLALLKEHRQQLREFQSWQQSLPLPPEPPKVPRAFVGMEPEEAVEQAEDDATEMEILSTSYWWILMALAVMILACGFVLLVLGAPLFSGVGAVLSLTLGVLALLRKRSQDKGKAELAKKYGSEDPKRWIQLAQKYQAAVSRHQEEKRQYRKNREEAAARGEQLKQRNAQLCEGKSLEQAEEAWREIQQKWIARREAEAAAHRAREQWEALKLMARPLPEPAEPDDRTETLEQTRQLLRQNREEQQRLQTGLGEIRGRMTALGSETELRGKLEALNKRILELERTHEALQLAQQTLQLAEAELQRRFSPRIAKRAQSLMARMTGGRYDRIVLGTDLSLQAGATGENTLRQAHWRSEGTVDQLYLCLRLAVSEELTAKAPLVLDDALVRFDDERLSAAMEILKEMGKTKQVILFTCTNRETKD